VIIVYGGLKTHKVRVEESTRCFQYTASPERDKPRSLREDGFAGTGHTLLRRHKAAFPTNDCFAGTNIT
jgi:hypothetical protein